MEILDEYCVIVETTGSEQAIKGFLADYLIDGDFSLESLAKTPRDLIDIDDHDAQEGYEMLFGNWERFAGRWKYKAYAESNKISFPLPSREMVISAEMSVEGERNLNAGRRYKENHDKYGFFDKCSWRKFNWGGYTRDVYFPIVDSSDGRVIISFYIDASPLKLMTRLSKSFKGLDFEVCFCKNKLAEGFLMRGGKKIQLLDVSTENIKNKICLFRRDHCLAWYKRFMKDGDQLHFDVDNNGGLVFIGASVYFIFVIAWLRSGGNPEEFHDIDPSFTDAHMRFVIAYAKHRRIPPFELVD